MRGYEAVTLDAVPGEKRKDFRKMLAEMGPGAQIFRKPDGSLSIMGAPEYG